MTIILWTATSGGGARGVPLREAGFGAAVVRLGRVPYRRRPQLGSGRSKGKCGRPGPGTSGIEEKDAVAIPPPQG